jgi:membrane associated rhomboid family serine protease
MFESIWRDIRQSFAQGNMLSRLIIINVAVYVAVNLVWVVARITSGYGDVTWYHNFVHFFCVSSDWTHNLLHPWAIITSAFLHEGFWHILWNMLYLYWFGRILGDFLGDRRILPIYMLGAVFSAVVYFLSANLLEYGGGGVHYALGASGAVMAIVAATGFLAPEYEMRLLLIGPVKLKFIVLFLLLIDIIGLGSDANTGGHFAHLGGALFGGFFIYQLRLGNDLSIPANALFDKIGRFVEGLLGKAPRPRVVHRNKKGEERSGHGKSGVKQPKGRHDQARLDAILDKIKQSGYESLSAEEKEFLFRASNH